MGPDPSLCLAGEGSVMPGAAFSPGHLSTGLGQLLAFAWPFSSRASSCQGRGAIVPSYR